MSIRVSRGPTAEADTYSPYILNYMSEYKFLIAFYRSYLLQSGVRGARDVLIENRNQPK